MVMKKSLYILYALLLSSTVQVEAMQDDYNNDQLTSKNINTINNLTVSNYKKQTLNNISNIIDKSKLDKTKKEEILSNINKINDEDTLCQLYEILHILPILQKTGKAEDVLLSISKDEYQLGWLHNILGNILFRLCDGRKAEELLLNVRKNVNKLNNINTLRNTKSSLINLLSKNINKLSDIINTLRVKKPFLLQQMQTKDVIINVINDIREMNDYKLYALSMVLDILPKESEKTVDALFFISTMNYDELVNLYLVLCYLPDSIRTTDMLTNILTNMLNPDNNNYATMFHNLSIVLRHLPKEGKIPEILENIISIDDDAALHYLFIALCTLPKECKTTEILLNISKIKDRHALSRLGDVIRELPEEVKTTEILSDISKMNAYALDWTHYMFDKLRLEEIQKETLPNIIKDIIKNNNIRTLKDVNVILSNLQENKEIKKDLFVNISNNISKIDEDTLSNINKMDKGSFYNLCNVLDRLPSDKTTPQTLFNISKMRSHGLYYISTILGRLPDKEKTQDILLCISEMNEGKLIDLDRNLNYCKTDEEKMEVLREFGVLQ